MNGTPSKKKELSKRSKQPSTYRRIVTGNADGKSIIQSDEQLQAYQFKSVPNYEHTLVWVSPTTPEQRFEPLSRLGRTGTWRYKSSLRHFSAGFRFCRSVV